MEASDRTASFPIYNDSDFAEIVCKSSVGARGGDEGVTGRGYRGRVDNGFKGHLENRAATSEGRMNLRFAFLIVLSGLRTNHSKLRLSGNR